MAGRRRGTSGTPPSRGRSQAGLKAYYSPQHPEKRGAMPATGKGGGGEGKEAIKADSKQGIGESAEVEDTPHIPQDPGKKNTQKKVLAVNQSHVQQEIEEGSVSPDAEEGTRVGAGPQIEGGEIDNANTGLGKVGIDNGDLATTTSMESPATPKTTNTKKAEQVKEKANTNKKTKAQTGKNASSPPNPQKNKNGSQQRESVEDLRDLLKALPTRDDIQEMLKGVERSCKSMVDTLKDEFRALGQRVEEVEEGQEKVKEQLEETQANLKKIEHVLNSLIDQQDDQENRSRRSNIRFRGIGEELGEIRLEQAITEIVKLILGKEAPNKIKIERVHRVPMRGPPREDRPRDIICKFHEYSLKEKIMFATRGKPPIEFRGKYIQLFQDLSYRTRLQRRSVRPLLEVLKAGGATYRWGFPFSLKASKEGKTAVLRSKEDLQQLLETIGLPEVDFEDWRVKLGEKEGDQGERWQKIQGRHPRR